MNGHSGCKIYLREEGGKKYIRKISPSTQYNSRLAKQVEKQESFKHDLLLTPSIYRSGYIDKFLYFDMEFIRGVPMQNYISLNNMNNILPIFDKICSYLQDIPVEKGDITSEIEQKLDSLGPKMPISMVKYCDYCRDYDWADVPISENHGDLTFENILIYRNNLYFIDFLDSFTQTKYIDYSKILQDIILDWSWRHNMNKPLIKTIYLYNKILEIMTFDEIEISKKLLVINLLRIIPYSNKIILKYLENRLQYLSKIFGI